jgi:2,3-bisphosphoglycerate-independent phosphoglycerate mutase
MQNKSYKKVVLVIIDGFGVATFTHGNAIAQAEPATLDFLVQHYPSMSLQASGPLVGLPWGEMGNSEVGHLNIGAGRIVAQDLPRITNSIADHSFFQNQVFLEAIEHAKKNKSKLHMVGMLSMGGVHSLDEHLYALIGLAAEQGIVEPYIHMFTDGRDTAQKVAAETIEKFRARIERIGSRARLATISGRFYAMDRGMHWDQTELTSQAMVNGIGAEASSPEQCIQDNYAQQIFDEMILPTVIMDSDKTTGSKIPVATIQDNDAIIFFNFRPDRTAQLVQAFVTPEVMDIPSKHRKLENTYVATMTEYKTGLPVHVAFPSQNLKNNLAELVSEVGLKQFHIAESEKYPHVTSFFNGGVSDALPGEDRTIVTSPNNTKNYLDHPEMSAEKLTDLLVEQIIKKEYNLYVVNFANPDMVGHTGNLEATVEAVKFVDKQLKKIVDAVLQVQGALIITGDHGNAEEMINVHTGEINKDHTTNPVPFILVAHEFELPPGVGRKDYVSLSSVVPAGVISDIAPTALALLGQKKPLEMTAVDLLPMLDQLK